MAYRHPRPPQKPAPHIALWMLRLITAPEGLQKFVRTTGFANDRLAFALGLDHWIDPEDRPFHPQTVRSELYGLLAQAEQNGTQALLPTPLQGNVQRLAALVGLSAVDAQILAFAVCLHTDQLLDDAADLLDAVSSTQVIQTLALLVQAPDAVRRSVVAHEVAHLVHFDHSPRFHAVLGRIYESDIAEANAWLAAHGRQLYAAFG